MANFFVKKPIKRNGAKLILLVLFSFPKIIPDIENTPPTIIAIYIIRTISQPEKSDNNEINLISPRPITFLSDTF